MAKKKFLQRVSLDHARSVLTGLTAAVRARHVTTEDSLGRVTAEPVRARLAAPSYRASAMDGIAVRATDTTPAGGDEPVVLIEVASDRIPRDDEAACTVVDTGNALPEWADAVVRIEDTRAVAGGFAIAQPVVPGRDVRAIGEDVADGALLFGRGHRIRPYDVGAMLATGVREVAVASRPSVATLATGSEVIEPGHDPEPGQVIEFNSRVLAGYLQEWGAEHTYVGRVADDADVLADTVRTAVAAHDIVCVIAGSSAGRKDLTVDVLAQCGEVLVHGVDMMPGKPVAIAAIDGKPVICVPGYPVSAVVVYRELLGPLVARMLGTVCVPPTVVGAQVRRPIPSRLGVEEFLRVCLAADGSALVVAPLPRGAGSITTLVRADAILRIPATSEGIDEGSQVEVELLATGCAPGATVVVSGPPDPLSALLAEHLHHETIATRATRFVHIGLAEYDAITALGRGETHLAVFVVDDEGHAAHLRETLAQRAPDADTYIAAGDGSRREYWIVASARLASTTVGQDVLAALADAELATTLASLAGLGDGVSITRR